VGAEKAFSEYPIFLTQFFSSISVVLGKGE
jgi:hypothetical protein